MYRFSLYKTHICLRVLIASLACIPVSYIILACGTAIYTGTLEVLYPSRLAFVTLAVAYVIAIPGLIIALLASIAFKRAIEKNLTLWCVIAPICLCIPYTIAFIIDEMHLYYMLGLLVLFVSAIAAGIFYLISRFRP